MSNQQVLLAYSFVQALAASFALVAFYVYAKSVGVNVLRYAPMFVWLVINVAFWSIVLGLRLFTNYVGPSYSMTILSNAKDLSGYLLVLCYAIYRLRRWY